MGDFILTWLWNLLAIFGAVVLIDWIIAWVRAALQ